MLALILMPSLDAQSKRKRKKSKKDNKKSSALRNAYQDMTARYNGYFNAKLIMQESLLSLKDANRDNFKEILPIFDFTGGDEASAVHAQMNKIIEKCSADITLHPNSKWVDDCYLLIGKARFFKGEYEEALVNFSYIERKFGRNIRKGAKQKKGKVKRNRKGPGVDFGLKSSGAVSSDTDKIRENLKEERAQNKKDKDQARKDKAKENKKIKKEREKAKKKLQKERAKEKKQKEKERARLKKMSKEKRRKYIQDQKAKKEEAAAAKIEEEENKEADLAAEKAEEARKAADEEAAALAEKEAAEKAEAEALAEKEQAEEEEAKQFDLVDSDLDPVRYDRNFLGFLSHRPAKFEGAIWQARTLMSMERYDDAISLIEGIRENSKMPKKFRGEMNALYAGAFLQNEDPVKAYAALSDAIKSTRGKKKRARLHFIQGQISQDQAQYALAMKSYKRVLKSKPSFEMEFHSRLQMAGTKMQSGEYASSDVIRDLEKMLKEEKYDNHQDEIYMMMANIAIEEGDIEQAMAYLGESAANSTMNNEMKAEAYLRLAELHFQQESYLLSSYYYDSTASILPKDYPEIDDIISRKEILGDLAGHIRTVEYEDSLQHLAQLPVDERNRIIDELIDDLEQKIEDEKLAAEQAANAIFEDQNSSGNSAAGSWYFYNETAKSMGYNEFQSIWGNRSYSDNWRLSGTAGDEFVNRSESEAEQARIDLAQTGRLSREAFLADIPFNEEAVLASNNKIIDALFGSGNIYKDKLDNKPKAINSFTELNDRFAKNIHEIPACYSLYLLYRANDDNVRAEQMKKYIIANDATGEYAGILQDPEAASRVDKEAQVFYEQSYKLYLAEKFEEVSERQKEAANLYASSEMTPQFDLLGAFVVGQTEEKKLYIDALKEVKDRYPSHEVGEKAAEILKYISKEEKEKDKAAKESIYKFKMKSSHYYILTFGEYVEEINDAIIQFSNHNTSKFKLDRLKVTPMLLNPENQIVLVKTFPNGEKAMSYYKQTNDAIPELLEGIPTNNYKAFVISKTNFAKFFKSKDVDIYLEFFEENYLD